MTNIDNTHKCYNCGLPCDCANWTLCSGCSFCEDDDYGSDGYDDDDDDDWGV